VKKNSWAKTRKPRYSVVFHRPKTLKRVRDPKYTRKRCGGLWRNVSCSRLMGAVVAHVVSAAHSANVTSTPDSELQ
jgi:hypothetical protein